MIDQLEVIFLDDFIILDTSDIYLEKRFPSRVDVYNVDKVAGFSI